MDSEKVIVYLTSLVAIGIIVVAFPQVIVMFAVPIPTPFTALPG